MAKKKKTRTGPPAEIKTPQDEWRMYRWTKEEIELGLEFRKEALIEAKNLLKTGSPTIKSFVIKMALDTFGMSATELAKLTEGGGANGQRVNVTVQIASWAAKGGSGAQPQFATPAHQPVRIGDPIEVDYIASDRALESDAPRNSAPAPDPANDPEQRIVAYTKFGAPVSKKRLADLQKMGADTSEFVFAPLAAGSGNYETRRGPDRVERVVAVENADRDRERYRAMCREAGKPSQPGEEGYTTNFKLFE